MNCLGIALACLGLILQQGLTQPATYPSPSPGLKKLRFEEDYSDLPRNTEALDWPLSWKNLPLSVIRETHVSVGGEVRQRYEYTDNPQFGEAPQDAHGVWLQRYSLHADWQRADGLRIFSQLTSALENGRSEGPSPVDEDRLE